MTWGVAHHLGWYQRILSIAGGNHSTGESAILKSRFVRVDSRARQLSPDVASGKKNILPNALTCWHRISRRLRFPRPLLLLMDFDGTLAEIVPNPADAEMRPEVPVLLKRLAGRPCLRLGFVSGRSLRDLKKKVGMRKAVFVGSHGLEVETTGGRLSWVGRDSRATMRQIKDRIDAELGREPGIYLEDKDYTLAVHYRRASPAQARLIRRRVMEVAREFPGKAVLQKGKKILEFLPAIRADKGTGVRALLREPSLQGSYPLYLGDDLTDEAAFAALGKKALTLFVGPPGNQSAAQFHLSSPQEVEQFLRRLVELRK